MSESVKQGGPGAPGNLSVEIGGSEQADKPLPTVIFVSSPRGARAGGGQPREVVIGREEFRRLSEEIRAVGRDCAHGPYVSDEPQYFAEVTEDGQTWNCGLGFSRRTVEALERMAGELGGEGARAVRDVIEALGPLVGGESR